MGKGGKGNQKSKALAKGKFAMKTLPKGKAKAKAKTKTRADQIDQTGQIRWMDGQTGQDRIGQDMDRTGQIDKQIRLGQIR